MVFVTNYGVRVAIRRRIREFKPKPCDSDSQTSTESFFGNRDLVLSRYFEEEIEEKSTSDNDPKGPNDNPRPYIIY